uniref:RING-type E3 ubiquitin transferase n=1 Tax=Globisporangium ultimum (strain ATCC 200006 / CBS 805.95 / DAOM BR144) TaxID=431595 RepID=K3X027_GLOUD
MASFDDLAFISHARASSNTASSPNALFCRDCNEVAQQTTDDGKRCLICGCELQDTSARPSATHSDSTRELTHALGATADGATPTQDLQALMTRLLSVVGGDLDGAVTHLGSFVADQASTIEVTIRVQDIKGEVVAVPANFGPCESISQRDVVLAEPFDGASAFANAAAMNGKVVVMERGVCTFAQKVLRAQAAGAVAAIIIQTMDVWPYTMTDSKGESATIAIPAFMLSAKQGHGFVEFLRARNNETVTMADITVRRDARECVICQVDMAIGMKVTRMPCQHLFHTECLHEWLKIGNSCPICRVEIPAKQSAARGTFVNQTAQQRGDFAWSDWFS